MDPMPATTTHAPDTIAPTEATPGQSPSWDPGIALMLEASFGSVARWRDDIAQQGQALRTGPGRLMLVLHTDRCALSNRWLPDGTHPAAGDLPLLTIRPADPAFLASIDWAPVKAAYQQAVTDASEPHGSDLDAVGDGANDGVCLLDVRRAGVFGSATTMIPGAQWRDPAQVATWAAALHGERAIVVYCVYGHEVSRATTMRLRALGLPARFLRGGIDEWQRSGRPLAARRPLDQG